MDRELTKQERNQSRRRTYIKAGAVVLAVAGAVAGAAAWIGESYPESDFKYSTADRGNIDCGVTASGTVAPLHELIVTSPVSTKILEVYRTEGDTVAAGAPLLCLDLQATEADYRRASDEAEMKRNEIEQTALANATYITDLEMRIRTKRMAVSHLEAEVANERRLDSIGSGTGDRIREAQLAYETGKLELQQLCTQLDNERRAHEAALRTKRLEGDISARNLDEMRRTLDDAGVLSPIRGTVTYINKTLGTSISAGEKLAVVSDLTHFKVNGEITEGKAGKLAAGAPVSVRIGTRRLEGRVGGISPKSTGGVTEFTVILDEESNPMLRPGLKTELNVTSGTVENVVRIANGPYYQGPGEYDLFVRRGDKLILTPVTLGDGNFEYVEVTQGLEPGDIAVVSDMHELKNKKKLTLK